MDWITVLIIQLVLTLPFYTASVYGLTISNVAAAKTTSNSAIIEWNTDTASNSRVKYGKTSSLGFMQRQDDFVQKHAVVISGGIDSDTNYLFSVESTDLSGAITIDNNSGSFYTFRTNDITPPAQVTGLKLLSSTPNSIFLSWNDVGASDFSHYVIYRNGIIISNSTIASFNDTNIQAGIEFKYKVSAADTSGNEGLVSDILTAFASSFDLTAPVISNVDVLPLSDTTARVTWITDENATTTVLYGINKTDKKKASEELVTNHTLLIDGLVKGIEHIFVVKSCDKSNNCANSSNQSFISKKDTEPPFINLTIQRFVNRRAIDLVGSTKPFTQVTLFVNDLTIPKRALSSSEVGSSGKFIFREIQLGQDNVIKVVMADKFANRNEKTFEVSVDTQSPAITLDEIPSLTSKKNFSITGRVSEPLLIKVFVDANTNESLVTSQVTGLNITKTGQNSVELRWDESKDKEFNHYIVYREGSGPIALTKPANFNLFIDALVDSGKSYTYEVSAMNVFGNEGQKSEPITAKTLAGGQVLNLKPPQVDIFEDFRKPALISNSSDKFNLPIKLNKGDWRYKLKLVFEDRAANIVIMEKDIALDTKKPTVKITSPPSGSLIFENVASEVDVIGKTEPNARVHLFVDRTPFSFYENSIEITTGLPNDAKLPTDTLQTTSSLTPQAKLDADIRNLQIKLDNFSITEKRMDAKCRSGISISACPTGADFSTDADAQGNFIFKSVDLTLLFGGGARIKELSPSDFRDTQLNQNKESRTANIVVIATDKTGQRGFAAQKINIGTCWSGNQSWDIIPLTEHQSPVLLSTERLSEGTEEPNFFFNYSYIGAGTRATIISVSIVKACGTKELLDPRFNISCQIMPNGVTTKSLNPPENTVSYSAMHLSRFKGMDSFVEADWKSFIKAINKEMTFPLKVRITYKHDTDGDTIMESETQTTCEQVSYVVDSSIIDFRKAFPDWLLYDFVDFLQTSIKTLTDVQEQLQKVIDYVAIGCLGSFGLNFVTQFYRRWVTFWEEKKYAFNLKTLDQLAGLISGGKSGFSQENQEYCKNVVQTIVKKYSGFKLKYVNDIELKKCFPTSASAWDYEARTYTALRWSCDRIFGHAAPSKWTETESDDDLRKKIETIEGCESDESVRGQVLRAESCTEFARKNPSFKAAETFGADAKCTLVRAREGPAVYTVGQLVQGSERLYQLNHIQTTNSLAGKTKYAVQSRQSEVSYTTAQSKDCDELCNEIYGGKKQGRGDSIQIGQGKQAKGIKYSGGDGLYGECTTTNKCRSLNAKDGKDSITFTTTSKEGKEASGQIKYARTWGYTNDCFYSDDPKKDPIVVSDSPSEREECCCISTNKPQEAVTRYYQPDDYDPLYEPERKPVHQSKKESEGGQALGVTLSTLSGKDYADMKWSYRYWKEKFQAKGSADGAVHSEYHPKRYIEGKDLPACLGQDNLFYKAFGDEKKVLTVDPFKDHFAALQCVHLSGISSRLQFLKNLMASFSTCLIQVRTSGKGDSGACKELFTQHLCDAIWQFIRFFTDQGCATTEFGTEVDEPSDNVADYVKGGFKSIYGSISDLQSEISHEYGNAKLNDLLGTGEESVARKVCLAAFGYDWELSVKNLVDASYTTPFATLVQPITRKREFLAIEPTALRPKYEYRSSWIINPGCDFERYDVYLTCVGRKQLDTYKGVNCGEVGGTSIASSISTGTSSAAAQCDCIQLPDEKGTQLLYSGKLKRNILEDKKFHKVIDNSNFRYDHLKFVLRPDRKTPSNIKSNCFPQGYDDGIFYFPLLDNNIRDIADCHADPLSGSFTCGEGSAFATAKGIAEFIELKINDVDSTRTSDLVFSAGDLLKVDATIKSTGPNKCLKVSLDGQPQVAEVFEGIQQYSLDIGQLSLNLRSQISAPSGITVKMISPPPKEVSISVRFFDKNNNGIISLGRTDDEGDEVEIDGSKSLSINSLFNSGEIVNSGAKQVEVSVENQQMVLKKEGAEIAIVGVDVRRGSDGKIIRDEKKSVAFADGVIRVFAQPDTTATTQSQQTQQQSQTRKLTIGLYHTRDNTELTGIDACNLNEPVIAPGGRPQERIVNIRVEQKPTESGQQSPSFSNIRLNGLTAQQQVVQQVKLDREFISVSATIRHIAGIESAALECKMPDGKTNLPKINSNPPSSDNNYQFDILSSNIENAGLYDCKITAKSKNSPSKTGSASVKFEVMCGDKEGGYGKCRGDKCCSDSDCKTPITAGLPCFVPVKKAEAADTRQSSLPQIQNI